MLRPFWRRYPVWDGSSGFVAAHLMLFLVVCTLFIGPVGRWTTATEPP
jgi:hypothetical protein